MAARLSTATTRPPGEPLVESSRSGLVRIAEDLETTAAGGRPIRLVGNPIELRSFAAQTIENRNFARFDLRRWNRYFLPPTLSGLAEGTELERFQAIEDDNRGAVVPTPVAALEGMPFFLSIKGVGSSVDPFSMRRLDEQLASDLSDDPVVRERLRSAPGDRTGGVITGELWLRGSPYGGQGLPHAMTALRVSELADLTSIQGFRIAPVVKVALLPEKLQARLRSIHWYRKYRDQLVQELRLVPSNVRVYFHARSTLGTDPGKVFDLFEVDSAPKAHRFVVNLVRSGVALLTLFARTLSSDAEGRRLSGLDFQDVWLDKDAVLAPDGTVFFVDLEGIDTVSLEPGQVREKLEDQVFRSLYEFMFAYEQVDGERARRFGSAGSRKRRFEAILEEALRDDRFARVRATREGMVLQVRNRLEDESLWWEFPLTDA